MRNAILCLAAAFTLMAAAPGIAEAGAFSATAATIPAPAAVNPGIIMVAGGCGLGFHRGPHGRCRPNWVRPRPVHHWKRCVRRMTPHGWRTVCRYY
jgi:hypothetical protein